MSARLSPVTLPGRRITLTACLILMTGSVTWEARGETPPEGAPVPTVDTAQQPMAEPGKVTEPEVHADEPVKDPEELSEEEPGPTPDSEVASQKASAPEEKAPPLSTSTEGETTASTEVDLDSKPYDRERPNWAIGVSYSPEALGNGATLPDASAYEVGKVRGISLQMEWEPAFIQLIGVLGLGINAQLYPEYPKTGLTKTAASLFSYGAQVRYQLKVFRGQWIVPMAGYSAEQMQYSLPSSVKGSFVASGPFAGAMILLNPLDPGSAGEFYAGMGVKRTYLFAEMRLRTGSAASDGLQFGENSWFAGVRSEW